MEVDYLCNAVINVNGTNYFINVKAVGGVSESYRTVALTGCLEGPRLTKLTMCRYSLPKKQDHNLFPSF